MTQGRLECSTCPCSLRRRCPKSRTGPGLWSGGEQSQGCFRKPQALGRGAQVKPELQRSGPPPFSQADPAHSHPPRCPWCQARDEGHIPGEVCPLNHTAVLIHIVISSAVHSQREEIIYKISPKIRTEAQSKPQRKIVLAGKDGASVAHVDPPVAVDARVMWQRRSPHSWRDFQGFCFFKTAFKVGGFERILLQASLKRPSAPRRSFRPLTSLPLY